MIQFESGKTLPDLVLAHGNPEVLVPVKKAFDRGERYAGARHVLSDEVEAQRVPMVGAALELGTALEFRNDVEILLVAEAIDPEIAQLHAAFRIPRQGLLQRLAVLRLPLGHELPALLRRITPTRPQQRPALLHLRAQRFVAVARRDVLNAR